MLNFNTFLKGFYMFIENFEFTNSELYTEMVYGALKDKLTDKRFLDTCNHILIETSKDDWNKAYGFKGRPAIKDWTDAFIPKPVAKTRSFKNPNTGGMQVETYYDYPDDYLEELKLNSEKKQLEGQQTTQNQKNIQTYIKQINNNLKSK